MKCPRLHGKMTCINLSADLTQSQEAFLCPDCHGVWMRAHDCRAILGLEPSSDIRHTKTSSIPIACPHCQSRCHMTRLYDDDRPVVDALICPQCFSIFLDACGFALLFFRQLKTERASSNIASLSPLDNPNLSCCDCGGTIKSFDDAHYAGIGYCCGRCHDAPPILSENKLQNVQLVTFHGMEIKIDHWLSSVKSRISITPAEPCLFNVRIFSLSIGRRLLRFGLRTFPFGGKLGQHLDATQCLIPMSPWHVFISQRGVAYCLEELNCLGQLDMVFKPHCIVIELSAIRRGSDIRMRFESLVRRLLLVYERFSLLTHQFENYDEIYRSIIQN